MKGFNVEGHWTVTTDTKKKKTHTVLPLNQHFFFKDTGQFKLYVKQIFHEA